MKITETVNKFNFDLSDLFLIGKRANNPKRNFLFVSKLLGKHLDVTPDICKATGFLLSSVAYGHPHQSQFVDYLKNQNFDIKPYFIPKDTDKKVLVIGFAETATGLGQSVANAINDSRFYTTTREVIDIPNLLTFEEEHSHATTHKMYTVRDLDFSQYDELVLVDDEITTGNSMLNLVKELHQKYEVKNFKVLTILDWRNEEHHKNFIEAQNEFGITIDVHSILSGTFESDDDTVYSGDEETEITRFVGLGRCGLPKFNRYFRSSNGTMTTFLADTGRFGIEYDRFFWIEKKSKEIGEKLLNHFGVDKKILVVGHGENIYIPSRIASYMGDNTKFRTTTRSPIFVDGEIIKSRSYFMDNGVKYYFYNAPQAETEYDVVIFLTESDLCVGLTNNTFVYKL